MRFETAEPFWKDYGKLPESIQQRAVRAFDLFKEGATDPPFHPSLRVKKMRGHPDMWEGHITEQYVFTFEKYKDDQTEETVFLFRRIGTHEVYRSP